MQWVTPLFELEAPVLFCVRKLRPTAFVIGIGFHFMIALLMKDLIFFSAQMWTFYALFITADEWRALGRMTGVQKVSHSPVKNDEQSVLVSLE